MLIILKNKDTLILDDFMFKCSVGKNGLSSKKREGDKTTPKGVLVKKIMSSDGERVWKYK